MTIDQLDRELASWQAATQAIVNNVYGLYEHPTYRALVAKDPLSAGKITGVTRQRVDSAVVAVKDLLDLSLTLDELVRRAAEMRTNLPMLFPGDQIEDIHQLLSGPSLKLPAAETPLAQRDLLSGAATIRALTPQQLLDVMLPAYDTAKATILGVDRIWTQLPEKLDAAQQDARSLEAQAAQNGLADEFDIPGILRRIESARTAIMEDPLGASSDLDTTIRGPLDSARKRLQSLLKDRQGVSDELFTAGDNLKAFFDLLPRAEAAQAERQLKVELAEGASIPAVPTQAQVAGFREWHARLQAAVQRGEWQSARVGLDKWQRAMAQTERACNEALTASERALSDRRELRGRLDAMKSKAIACGRSEDPTLSALEEQATTLIQRRPTPLTELTRIVATYQRELTARTRVES